MLHITFSLVLFSSFFWRYSLSIEAVYVNSYQAPFYDAYNRAVNSQNDDIHRAVEQYKLALSGIPNLEQAHQNIALLYDTLGQTELALRHHYAAEQSSESPRFKALCICNIVSNKLSQLSNRNLAGLQPLLEMLQRAWTLDPLNAQVAMTTAFAYIQVGLHEEAVLSLVELVSSLEPDHTLALLNIGNHYFYKRDYTTAVLFYAKVLHQYLRSSYTTGPDKSYRDDLVSKSLLILNNMGQSYRELGLMRHSHNVLGFAVMEFGLLSAVADPVSGRVLRNSSGVLSDLLRAIRGRRERQRGHMERVLGVTGGSSSPRTVDLNRISAAETPPQHSHLEELHIWSLMNLYSVQGISLFWQKYEVMEELLIAALPVCSSVSLSGGRSSGTDKLSLANDDICFASSASAPRGAPDSIFDPYTYSLMRYSSLDSDDKCLTKDVCKLCWAEPIERVGHGGVAAVESKVKVSLQRPLRVGYLSYDWRDHPMGRLTRHLVTSHNTRHFLNNSGSELFEIFLYSYGPNDGSAIRQFIERASRENVHITLVELFRYKNDRDVAGMIAAAQLDILVDITSHTYNGRIDLAALNPSNVIINYLGYPGTTGCRAFDYSMVDARVVPPESARGFTEKLIYLPYNYQSTAMPLTVPLCWTREDKEGNVMSGVRPSHRSESCRNRLIATIAHTRLLPLSFSTASDHMGNGTRAVFSQQEKERRVRDPNSILICSFNAVKKFEPVSFAAWMNILHRLGSRSLLVLIDIETPFARDNMFNLALFHGISPNRLVFVRKSEWEAHLGRAASCDVVVDNFVYGAHTTASDMIFMGIPVVALESWGSGRMPSRVAAGITRSLFASSSAVASADAAAGEHSLRSRAQAEHKERLHSLMVVQDARQYEDTVIRLLRSRRSDGNGAGTAGVISRLHMNMFSQSLKQPAFNKYLQQYVTERAFFVAQEVYHLRTGLDQASSGALIPYHIAVAPSYYEQIGQMSADGVEALTPKDLCWDVYAAVVSFADGQGVDVDPKEALRWETSMLAVFPEKVAEVVASLSAAPPDELAGAQVQIGTMLCRGVYGQCSMLSAEELSAHSARALHELCSYEQDLASTNPDSHRSESAIESAAVVPGDTSEVAPGSPIFDRLFSGSREDSQRACMSNSAGVGPSISAFDRMFPPSSSSHVAAIDWVHRITDRKAGDDKFIQTDGFIRRHYFGASGGVCLNISKEDVLLLYSSDRSEAARCASEGERGTAKLEEGAVTVGDVRSRLVKLLSHEVESLIISDLYSGTGTGTSTATVAEDTEESASARAGGGQTCTAETAVLVREFLYQLLRAQSELSEMGASFAGVGGCQLEDVMFSDYKSLFYSQYDGWPHNEVFSQTAHHESDDGRKELFLSTKRLLQSAESPFHLAGDDKPRNSFPLLLFSPMMKIAASIGRNALNPYPDLDRDIAAYLDMFLNNHAVCMSRRQPQQAMASVAHMLSGYINMPSPTRLRFVGLMIQQDIPEFSAFGYKLASEAILQQHLEEYHAHKLHSSISLPLFAPVQPAGDVAAPSVRLHIVFYCEEYGNAWWPNWGPSSVRGTGRGAGGSEEAVIYIARELAAMGHLVEVYAEPSPVDHCRRLGDVSGGDADVESDAETQTPALCSCAHTDNVCWFHYSEFDVMGDSHLREDVHLYKAVNGQQSLLGSTSHTGANPIVFISWRYPLSLLLGKFRSSAPTAGGSVATHIYLWVHDLLPHLALPLPLSSTKNRDQLLRRIFVQSMYHKLSLPEHLHAKYSVLPNGISTDVLEAARTDIAREYFSARGVAVAADAEQADIGRDVQFLLQISETERNHALNSVLSSADRSFKFIYGSAPNRGLEEVLKIWPYIKRLIPAAELHVYYGFGQTLDEMMKRFASRHQQRQEEAASSGSEDAEAASSEGAAPPARFVFEDWKSYMMRMLRQEGIVYHGSVGHHELARAYHDTGFLLYPTRFSETGCITCIKAMIAGCLPISSRYQVSVLGNLYSTSAESAAAETAMGAHVSISLRPACAGYNFERHCCTEEGSTDCSEPPAEVEVPVEGLTHLHDLGPPLAWDPDFDSLTDELFDFIMEERGILRQLQLETKRLQTLIQAETNDGRRQKLQVESEDVLWRAGAYQSVFEELHELTSFTEIMERSKHGAQVPGGRFDRWLHTHYLPSVIFASKYMDRTRATRLRNHMMEYSMTLYNWRSSAALMVRQILA